MKRRCWSSALMAGLAVSAVALSGGLGVTQQINPPSAPPSPAPAHSSAPVQAKESTSLPAQPSPYRITGFVVDTVTKSPIPSATLTAAPMTTVKRTPASRRRARNQSDSPACESGPDGNFDLAVPSAGGWELTASARGYRTQPLDEHEGYSTAVVLTETTPRFSVTFRMTPASIIEGFVLDEGGEAVRGANVALVYLPPPTPGNQHRRPQSRAQQMTDDRGFYRFGDLEPGSYEVRVTAHPWYATAAERPGLPGIGGSAPSDNNSLSGPDPLDVVYATVWYPGVTDPSTATPITLHGGDTQEANFRLLPIPGSHLRVAGPTGVGDREPQSPVSNTYLTRLLPDGTEDAQQTPTRMDSHGSSDIAGLSPGTYLVHQQSPSGGAERLSTIQIGAGSARVVDVSEGAPATMVTMQVDPAADLDSLQISFREVETGHTTYAQRFQDNGRQQLRRRGQLQNNATPQESHAARTDRMVSLLPGKYEVFLSGIGDVHLASIEATGATAVGRMVTIGSGSPKLFLHTAAGLGTVTGIVSFKGQPLPGAMVMLIPATLGSAAGLDLPSRDQSNSDGSFEMSGLLPGGYILVAIDRGWEVNWSDPSTLRRYLVHGMPLDIKPGSDLKQTIEAQSP